METITLHFDSTIKTKLMNFLQNFSEKEQEIIEETEDFKKAKAEIHKDYQLYISGNTELMTIQECENEIDKLLGEL
jgi:hypothetical protein